MLDVGHDGLPRLVQVSGIVAADPGAPATALVPGGRDVQPALARDLPQRPGGRADLRQDGVRLWSRRLRSPVYSSGEGRGGRGSGGLGGVLGGPVPIPGQQFVQA